MPPKDQTPTPVQRTRIMMWLAMLVIALTVVIAVVSSVRAALLMLAAALLAGALTRALSPAPGPYGISIRSRLFDVAVLAAGGVVIAALTLSLSSTALG